MLLNFPYSKASSLLVMLLPLSLWYRGPKDNRGLLASFSTVFSAQCLTIWLSLVTYFSIFFSIFLNPNIHIYFSNLIYNCSNLLDMRNLQEQVKKAFCYQKLF